MRVHPVAGWGSLLVHNQRLRVFGPMRLRQGTSQSLLVLRLRFRNQHINNHFPYVKVGGPLVFTNTLSVIQVPGAVVPPIPQPEERTLDLLS